MYVQFVFGLGEEKTTRKKVSPSIDMMKTIVNLKVKTKTNFQWTIILILIKILLNGNNNIRIENLEFYDLHKTYNFLYDISFHMVYE